MRLGVLDIGSNTIHLQIMDAHFGMAPVPSKRHKIELRLTEYLDAQGCISEAGISTLIHSINQIFHMVPAKEFDECLAFATSAIREAKNSEEIIHRVKSFCDIEIDVLTGEEEARFTFLAARRWLGWSAGILTIIDIGGGSVEFAYGADELPEFATSLPIGPGRLTRTILEGDPFTSKSLKKLEGVISEALHKIPQQLGEYSNSHAYGTSKTFRTLKRIQNSFLPNLGDDLTLEGLKLMIPKLVEMSAGERAELPGVSTARAGQIVAGAMVAQSCMQILEIPLIKTCPWALREGVILQRIDWLR